MFDDYANLRPWKGAAEILARDTSWGPLYDLDQLSKNGVKVSAVTYVFVPFLHILLSLQRFTSGII